MSDLLNMEHINSLPQPLIAVFIGGGDQWEVSDIDVETGCLRIIVSGLLQVSHISEVREFIDCDGGVHDSDSFYMEDD